MEQIDDTTHSTSPDMGKVYDDFAKAFGEADRLPTWRYVGKPAMESLLKPYFKPGVKFLDMGSASGRVEAGVLLPGGVLPQDITGVEISPEQVEMARVRIPGATFVVGDISDPALLAEQSGTFDVVFSHMVFEHVDDVQFAQVCANARRLLKDGGVFAFVVTHPSKMTDMNGNRIEHYGAFKTTAPWGGVLDNWRRSEYQTTRAVEEAGFEIESSKNLSFPDYLPDGVDPGDSKDFDENLKKYSRYPAIRLAVKAIKQLS